MEHIKCCHACKNYTLEIICPKCLHPAIPARPPKYSSGDKYASYRRQVKEEEWKKNGLL